MPGHLILASLVYGICHEPVAVFALPDQGCETLFCPDLDDLWGLPGGLIDQLRGSPTETDDRTLYPQAPPAIAPDFELDIWEPKLGQDECKTFAADSQSQASWDPQRSSESTNLGPCEAASGQLIWPRGCGNTEQNERTAAILSWMDGRYERSIDPLCEVKGGVSYWFARLPSQST